MSLGDIVVSLSANTARFESDMGKAAQFMERFANRSVVSAKQCENALKQMTEWGVTSVDRLQKSFDALNIKSSLQIEKEAVAATAAFEKIKNSGVASANEISRAQVALKQKLDDLNGTGNVMKGHIEGMNGFSLASVAAIAKIQILYSLINTVMSTIGSMPRTAIDAIEDYKSSIITNAALITSMQGGVKDVGVAYKENKVYAEALEKVLIKMDNETAASYKQLQAMNRTFVEQGVILDINNKKAVEGYTSIAQAVAVIAKTSPNPDMQYIQEVKGLMSGTMKPGNELLGMLVGIDKDIVAKIKRWKEAGTIPENIGPLLQGFAAAKGDIESLWETTKSTMATIRDQILRGGLSEGFAEIVKSMKEISKYAQDNKEKIQAFVKDTFADAKTLASMMYKVGEGVVYLGQPLLWGVITLGISAAIGGMRTFVAEMTMATGGINLLLAGMVSLGLYAGKKFNDNQNLDERVKQIRSKTLSSNLTREQLSKILEKNPLATNDDITSWIDAGAVKPGFINQMAINAMKEDHDAVTVPKVKPHSDDKYDPSKYNAFIGKYNQALDDTELDNYAKHLAKITTRINDIKTAYDSMSSSEQAAWTKQMRSEGFKGNADDAFKWIKNKLESNLKIADLKKGQEALDKAEASAAMEQFKSGLAAEEAALKEHYADSKIKTQDYYDAKAKLIQKASDKELAVLQDSLEKAKSYSLQPEHSEGAALEALAKVKDIETQIAKVKDDSAKQLADNMKNSRSELAEILRMSNEFDINAQRMKYSMLGSIKNAHPTSLFNGPEEEQQNLINAAKEKYNLRVEEISKMEDLNKTEVENNAKKYELMKLAAEEYHANVMKVTEPSDKMQLTSVAETTKTIGDVLMKGSKDQFNSGKELAKISIGIATAVGAIEAYTSMAKFGPAGMALGAAAAAAITLRGMQSAAIVDSQHYQGREFGGPVNAGQSYIVGEKRPELFTPGASGTITPYVPEGRGSKVDVTNVYQISTGVVDTVRAEIGRLIPLITQQSVNAVNQAINSGGTLAQAVGRR